LSSWPPLKTRQKKRAPSPLLGEMSGAWLAARGGASFGLLKRTVLSQPENRGDEQGTRLANEESAVLDPPLLDESALVFGSDDNH